MDQVNPQKNDYARHVSLFLAELLRTRKIGLVRASEIAEKVLQNINLIDTEEQFLIFVKELTRDFEELFSLQEGYNLHLGRSRRKDMEHKVLAFAAGIMTTDMQLAQAILDEAIKDGCNLDELCEKFPKFKHFVDSNLHQWIKTHDQ